MVMFDIFPKHLTLPCVPSCWTTSGFDIWKMVPLIILMVLLYFCVRLCSPFLLVLWWTQSWFVQNTGAKQPTYLVNADDVGTLLAIEVQPLDNRKRKVLFSSYYNGSLTYVCQKWVKPREQPQGFELSCIVVWIEYYWIKVPWWYQISSICHNSLTGEYNLRHGIFLTLV